MQEATNEETDAANEEYGQSHPAERVEEVGAEERRQGEAVRRADELERQVKPKGVRASESGSNVVWVHRHKRLFQLSQVGIID